MKKEKLEWRKLKLNGKRNRESTNKKGEKGNK
jgi:hypothetical protein